MTTEARYEAQLDGIINSLRIEAEHGYDPESPEYRCMLDAAQVLSAARLLQARPAPGWTIPTPSPHDHLNVQMGS